MEKEPCPSKDELLIIIFAPLNATFIEPVGVLPSVPLVSVIGTSLQSVNSQR